MGVGVAVVGTGVLDDRRSVLLPVGKEYHPNITILRSIWSADGNSVTVFLPDTTYYEDDPFMTGFRAVCDRVVGEEFF